MRINDLKIRLTGVLLVLASLAGCISTGGGGAKPQPVPALTAVDVVITTPAGSAIPGAAVVCNGLPWGETNEDGYLLRKEVLAGTQQDCVISAANYRELMIGHHAAAGAVGIRASLIPVAPPAPEVPVTSHALVGDLRLTPSGYVDDTGPVLPLYAHAGNLFHVFLTDEPKALDQMDKIAAAGFMGVRAWGQLGCGERSYSPAGCNIPWDPGSRRGDFWMGYVFGPDVTPDYEAKLGRFFDALGAHRLRLVFSQGDIRQIRNRTGYMQLLARVDAAHGGLIDFLDGANEGVGTGEADPNALSRFVMAFRQAGGRAVLSLTSVGESREEVLRYLGLPGADVYDIHSFRDNRFWDKIRHIFSAGYEGNFGVPFGMQSEPAGNGAEVSAIQNREELDDEATALMAAASFISRQAYVWFSGEGVILRRGLETEAGFYSVPRILDYLPRDLMAFPDVFHSGDRFRDRRIVAATGEARSDCRAGGSGGRFACVLYGPSGTYRYPVDRAFTGRVCNPATNTCEDVTKQRGDVLELTFTRGRVLTGQVH